MPTSPLPGPTTDNPGVNLTAHNPAGLHDPTRNGYSHAIVAEGGGRTAYIAGQGGEDRTGALSPSFSAQVRQAFANLGTVLDAVGARADQVTKIHTFVVDHDDSKLEIIADQVRAMFGNTLPAQTLVPVPRLALDGMLFEIDATAVLDGG